MSASRRVPCEVVFYSGYKGEERPRAVRIEGREIPVEEVLERRRIQDVQGRDVEEYICRMEGRRVKIISSEEGCFFYDRQDCK